MRPVGEIRQDLIALQRSLISDARAVDEGAVRLLTPHPALSGNIEKVAHGINAAALDLHGVPQFEAIADTLGRDAVATANKAGVLHAMSEHGLVLDGPWSGVFRGVVDDMTAAIRMIR